MRGQQEFYAPHPAQAGNRAPQSFAVGAASSAAAAITGNSDGGALYHICATTMCHVKFGRDDVGAATTADEVFGPGIPQTRWLHNVDHGYLRVIQSSAAGVLNLHRLT